MSVVSVNKGSVPPYLQGSQFHSSLDLNDDEAISVPTACFRATDTVSSAEDLHHLLSTVRFWGVAKCPYSVIDYILQTAGTESEQNALQKLTDFERELIYLTFLKELCSAPAEERLQLVIRRDEVDFLVYCVERGGVVDASWFSFACECNSMQCLQFVSRTSEKDWLTEAIVYHLIVHGYLHIIEYLHSQGFDVILPYAAVTSSAYGHLQVMKFYLDLKHPDIDTAGICVMTACHGQTECFKYACERGLLPDGAATGIIRDCCNSGFLDIVHYLHHQGEPLDHSHCVTAATKGHLAMLQYLHEQGCELTVEVCTVAARGGHLPCLQYLHEHGCPWDRGVTNIAALYNALACLSYLLLNGCDCDAPIAMANAVKFGALPVLQLLHEHGFPLPSSLCDMAMENNQLSCLKYLCENGAEWGDTNTDEAARYGRYNCLVYAHKHGCPWGALTCMQAATYGHLTCLQFAYENGAPWDLAAYKDSTRTLHQHPACRAYIEEQLAKLG